MPHAQARLLALGEREADGKRRIAELEAMLEAARAECLKERDAAKTSDASLSEANAQLTLAAEREAEGQRRLAELKQGLDETTSLLNQEQEAAKALEAKLSETLMKKQEVMEKVSVNLASHRLAPSKRLAPPSPRPSLRRGACAQT